jgi:hypothetical protein
MIVEPIHKGFFSFLWPDLRFDVCRHCTPGSVNEFVDVETFSDDVAEVRKEVTAPIAAVTADKVVDPRPSDPQDKASPEFTKELEMTVHRGESPVQNAPLVETHEDLPEGKDPSPLIVAFNESFGKSYWGELLSVGCERADARDGTSKLLTLWDSSKIMDETGEGASEQTSPPPARLCTTLESDPQLPRQKTLQI